MWKSPSKEIEKWATTFQVTFSKEILSNICVEIYCSLQRFHLTSYITCFELKDFTFVNNCASKYFFVVNYIESFTDVTMLVEFMIEFDYLWSSNGASTVNTSCVLWVFLNHTEFNPLVKINWIMNQIFSICIFVFLIYFSFWNYYCTTNIIHVLSM
jgi:hypothetical protein